MMIHGDHELGLSLALDVVKGYAVVSVALEVDACIHIGPGTYLEAVYNFDYLKERPVSEPLALYVKNFACEAQDLVMAGHMFQILVEMGQIILEVVRSGCSILLAEQDLARHKGLHFVQYKD